MSVNVSVDLSRLNQMLSGQSLARARYVLANEALQNMEPFVPYKNGDLTGSGHLDQDNNIVYNTPYAKAQFYGIVGGQYPVQHYTRKTHPEATKRWDLKAKSLYGDEWANKVAKSLLEGK